MNRNYMSYYKFAGQTIDGYYYLKDDDLMSAEDEYFTEGGVASSKESDDSIGKPYKSNYFYPRRRKAGVSKTELQHIKEQLEI